MLGRQKYSCIARKALGTQQVLADCCIHEYKKKAPGPAPKTLTVQDEAWSDARALWLSLKRNKTKNYFLPADPKPLSSLPGRLSPAEELRAVRQAWLNY